MKHFILSAMLAFVGAVALNAQEILPIPKCYPCEPELVSAAAEVNILPIPKCYPCEPELVSAAAEVNILPIPKCYPCEPELASDVVAVAAANVQPAGVHEIRAAIRREGLAA